MSEVDVKQLIQNSLSDIRVSGNNIIAELSVTKLLNHFVKGVEMTSATVSSPYIYVYGDAKEIDESLKDIVESIQIKVKMKIAVLEKLIVADNMQFKGVKQKGDDVVVVIEVSPTGTRQSESKW